VIEGASVNGLTIAEIRDAVLRQYLILDGDEFATRDRRTRRPWDMRWLNYGDSSATHL